MVPPPVGDPENFATTPFLAAIFDLKPGSRQPRDTNALARVHGFASNYNAAADLVKTTRPGRTNSWAAARSDLPVWYGAFLEATNPPNLRGKKALATNFTAQAAASGVMTALSECDPVFDELLAASRRPYCRFNVNYSEENPAAILLPHLAPLKHLCQVLRLRADAELALGRMRGGLRGCQPDAVPGQRLPDRADLDLPPGALRAVPVGDPTDRGGPGQPSMVGSAVAQAGGTTAGLRFPGGWAASASERARFLRGQR